MVLSHWIGRGKRQILDILHNLIIKDWYYYIILVLMFLNILEIVPKYQNK